MPERSRRARPRFSRGHWEKPLPRRRPGLWALLVGGLVVLGVGAAGFVLLQVQSREGAPVSWAQLDTADVHSLAFDPSDPTHLYFGHHGGLLESLDGGKSWHPTALSEADAMNVRVSDAGLIQIAGHGLYVESRDGGETWGPVPNDLPGLDLHAFVIDPADATHSWAFAVGHGLFETTDAGRHWQLRLAEGIGALTIYEEGGHPVLVGTTEAGLGRSTDGGLTWQPLGGLTGQLASLAASADGGVIYAGTTGGLQRSTDGGQTWGATGFPNLALTIGIPARDNQTVAVVDDHTRFFRSPDGGMTWPGPS